MNEIFLCRTPLSIHHWAGEAKTSRTLGAGLHDGIDLFGSRRIAWHRSHQRYRSTRTRHQIPNCYSESTRSGRQYSQSRIELVARNECAGATITVLVLVQRPSLRKVHSRRNDADAIKRVSTITTIPPRATTNLMANPRIESIENGTPNFRTDSAHQNVNMRILRIAAHRFSTTTANRDWTQRAQPQRMHLNEMNLDLQNGVDATKQNVTGTATDIQIDEFSEKKQKPFLRVSSLALSNLLLLKYYLVF